MTRKTVQKKNNTISLQKTKDIELSIQFSLDGFSFCVLDTDTKENIYFKEYQFEKTFLQEVKEQGVMGSKRAHRLVEIPPGDPKQQEQPTPDLLWHMCPIKYLQREFSTCLLDAFCSAMHDFGCMLVVVALRPYLKSEWLSAGNKNVWGDFSNQVN